MNSDVDHKSELRWAALVLAIFWGIATGLALLAWSIVAIGFVALGSFAAAERLYRVASQGASAWIRIVGVGLIALLVATSYGLLFVLNPAIDHAFGR